jgi:hypothetical protein
VGGDEVALADEREGDECAGVCDRGADEQDLVQAADEPARAVSATRPRSGAGVVACGVVGSLSAS